MVNRIHFGRFIDPIRVARVYGVLLTHLKLLHDEIKQRGNPKKKIVAQKCQICSEAPQLRQIRDAIAEVRKCRKRRHGNGNGIEPIEL